MTDDDFNRLYALCYEELRKLAGAALRRDPNAVLSPTTLVHEAWIRLSSTPAVADTSPAHFKAIAGRVMHRVLIDDHRHRHAQKRGGPLQLTVALDDVLLPVTISIERLLDLEAVLSAMRAGDERGGTQVERIAMLGCFGGLTEDEIAKELAMTKASVGRDLRFARASLRTCLLDVESDRKEGRAARASDAEKIG